MVYSINVKVQWTLFLVYQYVIVTIQRKKTVAPSMHAKAYPMCIGRSKMFSMLDRYTLVDEGLVTLAFVSPGHSLETKWTETVQVLVCLSWVNLSVDGDRFFTRYLPNPLLQYVLLSSVCHISSTSSSPLPSTELVDSIAGTKMKALQFNPFLHYPYRLYVQLNLNDEIPFLFSFL